MSQTNGYGFELTKAQAGQKYDLMYDQVDSYAAGAAIEFGEALEQGDTDNVAVPFAGGTFVGVAVFTHTVENLKSTGTAAHVAGDAVSVLRLGRVWMDVTGEFSKEDPAYVTDAGVITATAGSNTPIGKFLTSGEDELGVVEVTSALQGPQGPQGDPA